MAEGRGGHTPATMATSVVVRVPPPKDFPLVNNSLATLWGPTLTLILRQVGMGTG